ncbi:cytochrome P450 4p1-like isoform X1 [Drosophila virilis]|uniref:cytochrome P450 4p1-like isoform X1 n=1 Tax=Drosophila virilis TaxID=7244 RepID=UPI00017D3B71|nr:cytochrome P450 4p1-like isoform X1 [Drosophila virilis]
MVCAFIVIITLCVLLQWLYKINEEYYILSFCARRVRAKDDRSVESIAPIPKGRTIFANCFDLYGKDGVGIFQYHRRLAREMGSSYLIYSLGAPIYSIIDPVNAEFVLNNASLITKGALYDFIQPALRYGMLTSTGKKWHTRRKMITPTFHFNILGQFVEIFKAESQKFLKLVESQPESIISLSELIPRFTLNNICETAMGINLDELTEKGDRYRESIKMIERCFVKRLCNPLLHNNTMYKLLAASEDAPFLKVVHEFSSDIIAKRRVLLKAELDERRKHQSPDDDIYINKKRRFAMLDTLICAEKDGLIDHDGICEEVDTLMFGGFDTTSMSLIFTLLNLSLYEDMQELCCQEISEYIDDPSDLDITQLSNLKYLDRFIKETIRMFPPVPFIGRQTLSETELPNGLILPARTQIIMHIFDIHRNPKYWDSPEEFDPDRFLPENSMKRQTYAYIPFSAGQRNCIGQKYAMLETKTLLIFILKRFKILPITDPKELVLFNGITLCVKNNIKVKLVLRK